MAPPVLRPPKARAARIVLAIAILNFVILLFPPLTWIVGQGGIWFFVATGVIGVLSLVVMYRVDAGAEEE